MVNISVTLRTGFHVRHRAGPVHSTWRYSAMTSTKRHQPIVFALVCALVLIGGSLKAHAEDLFGFNPKVTSTTGTANVSNDSHELHVEFTLSAVKYGATNKFEVCGKFQHATESSQWHYATQCGPDDLEDKGSGSYKATWSVSKKMGGSRVKNSEARIKIKKTQGDGTVKESDWTLNERVTW